MSKTAATEPSYRRAVGICQFSTFTTLACLCFLANGLIGSWPSPVVPMLKAEDSPIPITSEQGAQITAIGSLTTLIGIAVVPFTIDSLGRKKLLLAAAVPFLANWLIVIFADSFAALLASRVVASLGGGIVVTVGGMYLSEIAESSIRGAIGTLHQIMGSSGTLLIFCVAPYTSLTVSSLFGAAFVLLFVLTFIWMPDSPYFLMMKGREEEAYKALVWLRDEPDPAELKREVDMIKRALQLKHETRGRMKDLLQQRVHRRTFLLVIGVVLLQLSAGASTLLAYSTTVFQLSGSSLDSNMCSIVVGAVQVLMNAVCGLLVDKVGRRPLMIGSFLGCVAMMAVEGTYFLFEEKLGGVPDQLDWVPLVALILYQMVYSVGVGTVVSTIVGEIYHVSVKGLVSSINSTVVGVYSYLLATIFQVISDDLGTFVAFYGFCVFCMIGALYIWLLLPETKGKTFAEINEEMDARLGRRKKRQRTDAEETASDKFTLSVT